MLGYHVIYIYPNWSILVLAKLGSVRVSPVPFLDSNNLHPDSKRGTHRRLLWNGIGIRLLLLFHPREATLSFPFPGSLFVCNLFAELLTWLTLRCHNKTPFYMHKESVRLRGVQETTGTT